MKRLSALLGAALLLLSVSLLVGCTTYTKRPDHLTLPDESESDIPVMADPEEPPKKRVALTYDDGPRQNADLTKKIIDELAKYDYHATFFVLGHRIANGEEILYMAQTGNEIGIHGYTHEVYYDTCSDAAFQREISDTAQKIYKYLPDYEIKLMRPIGGRITAERLAECPYAVIMWSVDSLDYENTYRPGISDEDAQKKIDTIVENVMSSVSDGDIILMHDIYESTYDATKVILERLHEEGYEVVTVSELLGEDIPLGIKHYSASN